MAAARREKGLYWDRAWKLVEGCTKVSPGCDNCWSEAETAMRYKHPHRAIHDRAYEVSNGKRFDGRILCREDNLELPLRTKRPTVWAVWNDLFHPAVSDDFRGLAYDVMLRCPQHTFLVLTKRAALMADYFKVGNFFGIDVSGGIPASDWPENVWHGVTCENQATGDERIQQLLRVPGRRFLSIEPMLGQVDDLRAAMVRAGSVCAWCGGFVENGHDCYEPGMGIHAVLLGGESGPGARPMHPDWVRSVRDQCAEADVPFFFKQWGEWLPQCYQPFQPKEYLFINHDGRTDRDGDVITTSSGWHGVGRVGKRAAGRLLDGRTHDDLPWISGV